MARLRREAEPYPEDVIRPATRGDCTHPRPCPFISCRYNLYLDVNQYDGGIKYVRPDLEPDEMEESCALDVAERGWLYVDDIAPMFNMVRNRVIQILEVALRKLKQQDLSGLR